MNTLWLPSSVLMLMQLGASAPGQIVGDRRPDPPSTVLYTSVLYSPYAYSRAQCTVMNTSDHTLVVSIELLNDGGKGVPLENPPHQPLTILPRAAGGIYTPGDANYDSSGYNGAYCRFSFSGDKESVRAILELFSQPNESGPVVAITSEAR